MAKLRMELSAIKINRLQRHLILLVVYSGALVLSYLLAYQIRFEFAVPPKYQAHLLGVWPMVVTAKLVCLWAFGQFASLLTYFSLPDLRRVGVALLLPSLVLLALWYAEVRPVNVGMDGTPASVPRGVIILDAILSFCAVAFARTMFRMIRERRFREAGGSGESRLVGIVGAGEVGARLAQELAAKPRMGMTPAVFFDDDSELHGGRVHGVPVVGPLESARDLLDRGIEGVVIAMPSAPAQRVREIVEILRNAGVEHQTVPSMEQLASGRVQVTQLRPVQIEDLLGRERVELTAEAIESMLKGKRVLVTGAGGSIGSELSRQVAGYDPASLVLVERAETQMFNVLQDLEGTDVIAEVADIQDEARMRAVLKERRPEVIFHAAAHKHVLLMEDRPAEALRNNTFGTMQLANLAREASVERFVFISTDKAINPTSVMGASKRLAEVYLQALNAAHPEPTRFLAVRFGNVLGSSGSVVPIFRQQIAAGGPVTVTDPEVTRYFMLTSEAVGLVLQAATMGEGGEIYVLDMGTPVKIDDLARQMIELSGYRPGEDIAIEYTGLKPGEKQFEEIRQNNEAFVPAGHDKILKFVAEPAELMVVKKDLETLGAQLEATTKRELKGQMMALVPEYTPFED